MMFCKERWLEFYWAGGVGMKYAEEGAGEEGCGIGEKTRVWHFTTSLRSLGESCRLLSSSQASRVKSLEMSLQY